MLQKAAACRKLAQTALNSEVAACLSSLAEEYEAQAAEEAKKEVP